MSEEETKKALAILNNKKDKLLSQAKNYRKAMDSRIAEVQKEIDKIIDNCEHEDDGGMFFAVCKKCGFVDN